MMKLFPESWKVCEADTVCAEIVDCVNKTAPVVDQDTGFRMIRTTNVKSGRIDLSETRFVEEAVFKKWTRRVLPRRNDIVLTREAPLGEVGLLRSDEKVFLGQRTMLYRAEPKKLNQQFLYYSMLGSFIQGQIRGQGSGATVEHLRVPDAEKLRIPVAPLEDQKKIAAVLSAYDDLIENNRRRIALLEKMAEEIYREWFVRLRFPGHEKVKVVKGVPEGWEYKPIHQLVKFLSGYSFKSEKYAPNGTFGVVTIKNVHDGYFVSNCTDFIEEIPSNMKKYCFLKEGDILMSLTGNVGRVCHVVGENLLLNQRVSKLIPCISSSTSFVYWFFRQKALQTMTEYISTGAAQQNLSPIKLGNQKVLLPSNCLLEQFEGMTKPLNNLIIKLSALNQKMRSTRDMLLPRLISGKLSVENLDIQFPPGMEA